MIDHEMLVQAARTAGAERFQVDMQVKRYVRDRPIDNTLGRSITRSITPKESFWGKDITLTCWMPQTQETFKVELNFLNDETDAEISLALAVAIVHAGDDATKRACPIYERYGVGCSRDDTIRQVVAEHLEGRTSGGHRVVQEPEMVNQRYGAGRADRNGDVFQATMHFRNN